MGRLHCKPESFHDAGDVVIIQGRYGGTRKATGGSTNAHVVHVWTVRGRKLANFQQYVDTAETRSLAGLTDIRSVRSAGTISPQSASA